MRRWSLVLVLMLAVPRVVRGDIVTDGFDFPLGMYDGSGHYVCQGFRETVNDCHHVNWNGTHLGEDWNRDIGSEDCGIDVFAAANGHIVYAKDGGTGWGRVLIIRHTLPDGTEVETLYGHLASFAKTSGDVRRGDKIGTIGSAGGRYPCHLHFEVRYPFCPKWGKPGPGDAFSSYGWTSPSKYIEANRATTPAYDCQPLAQWVNGLSGNEIDARPGMSLKFKAAYRNTGSKAWSNSGGVKNPYCVELRSVTGSIHGTVAACALTPIDWKSKYRSASCRQSKVTTGDTATFVFSVVIPQQMPSSDVRVFFRPYHGQTDFDGHSGISWLVHVRGQRQTEPPIMVAQAQPKPERRVPARPALQYDAAVISGPPEIPAPTWPLLTTGQVTNGVFQAEKMYSLVIEYQASQEVKVALGLGSCTPTEPLGMVLVKTFLTGNGNDWLTWCTPPFSMTADQLQRFPSLRLVSAQSDSIRLGRVRLVALD